jgi:rRNA maturation RNase YbeY
MPPLAVEFSVSSGDAQFAADELAGLEELSTFVLAQEDARGEWTIAVALIGDAELQQLHHTYMGEDSPTDVMTFPLEEGVGTQQGGDIAISVDHARTRAAEWGLTPIEEIRFLVVHGLLHLLGWQDDSEEKRARMLEHQSTLLEQFGRAGSRQDHEGPS